MSAEVANNPFFSIIVPTYNHIQYLKCAVESVISQVYENWELVIVDNCSEDGTSQYITELNHPKIRFLTIRNGGSIAMSRNLGVNSTRGNWIAFLDSDDWWTSNKLQVVANSINAHVDFVFHGMLIDGTSQLYPGLDRIPGRQLSKPVFLNLLTKGNPIATSSVTLRREIFNKIGGMSEDIKMKGLEDFNAWLKISRLTDNFLHIKDFLGTYRVHDSNMSSTSYSAVPLIAFEEFLDSLSKRQLDRVFANFEYVAGRLAFLNEKNTKAKMHLLNPLIHGRLDQRVKSAWMFTSMFCNDIKTFIKR
jgi:glycosyltransferase involved in cell wall biosynthesis